MPYPALGMFVPGRALLQLDASRFPIMSNFHEQLGVLADDSLDFRRWLISAPNPYHLRRRPKQCGKITKIGILSNDSEGILFSKIPNRAIR